MAVADFQERDDEEFSHLSRAFAVDDGTRELTLINCGATAALLNCPIEEEPLQRLSVEPDASIVMHDTIDPNRFATSTIGYCPSDLVRPRQVTDIHVRKPPEWLAGDA